MKSTMSTGPALPPPEALRECIACGERDWKPRYESLLQCTNCDFTIAVPDIDEDALRMLYGESYFRGDVYADYLGERSLHEQNFARRYEVMREAAGDLGSVFEVGCAYGLWLEFLSSIGVNCAGIDICREAIRYARDSLGLNAVSGDFLDLEILSGRYRVFVMWDTIEHLANPELFVVRMVDLMPPGGWLFFTTGDIGSSNARRRGARWRLIQPPFHLQYFSRATISRFLARCGLEVQIMRSEPVFRNLRSTLANLRVLDEGVVKTVTGVAARVVPKYLQEKVAFWVDLGDIMFVGARKP